MKIVAIVQARMGSTRLPGKVLLELEHRSVIELIHLRLLKSRYINQIVVGTTDSEKDDVLVETLLMKKITYFRGSESDVLDRYYQAACFHKADVILRITGDCPLIDADIVDEVIERYISSGSKLAYISNISPPTYPDGLDIELFTFDALSRAWQEARWTSEREHVTPYLRNHPELFPQDNVKFQQDYSHYRWTLDEEMDYKFLKELMNKVHSEGLSLLDVRFLDLIRILEQYSDINSLNCEIQRNEGAKKSLLHDREVTL